VHSKAVCIPKPFVGIEPADFALPIGQIKTITT
jgi:hypothetical protein